MCVLFLEFCFIFAFFFLFLFQKTQQLLLFSYKELRGKKRAKETAASANCIDFEITSAITKTKQNNKKHYSSKKKKKKKREEK